MASPDFLHGFSRTQASDYEGPSAATLDFLAEHSDYYVGQVAGLEYNGFTAEQDEASAQVEQINNFLSAAMVGTDTAELPIGPPRYDNIVGLTRDAERAAARFANTDASPALPTRIFQAHKLTEHPGSNN